MPSTSTYLLSALVATAAAQGTTPPKLTADCDDVVVFYARGNDAAYHDDRVSGYISEICDKFEGLDYSCDYIDIVFNATYGGDYCTQIAEGAANGIKEITDFNARCPNTKVVINGYSEGANVVGDVLGGPGGCTEVSTGIDPSSQAGQAISAVTLFGDVRHTADQSYNVLDGADKSGWVRAGDDLARLNRYSDVLRSYCAAGDPVCAGGNNVTYHLNYFVLHSDEASDWIVSKVLPLLKAAAATSSTSSAVASATISVPAINGTATTTTNCTTSLHQSTAAANSTSVIQPTSYSSQTVITLIDTNHTSASVSASPSKYANQTGIWTATTTTAQPITTHVTIGGSSSIPGSYTPSSPAPAPYVPGTPTDAPATYVTEVVTQYTTVCPAESTYASNGQDVTSTYTHLITSTKVSTFLSTITVHPEAPAATPAAPGSYQPEPAHPHQPQGHPWGHPGQPWEHQGHPGRPSHPEQPSAVYTTTAIAPVETTTTHLSAGTWYTSTLTNLVTYTTTITQQVTSTYLTIETATASASSSSVVPPYYPVGNQTVPNPYMSGSSSSVVSQTTFLTSTGKSGSTSSSASAPLSTGVSFTYSPAPSPSGYSAPAPPAYESSSSSSPSSPAGYAKPTAYEQPPAGYAKPTGYAAPKAYWN